jgi:aryl-alcohol dehydrogenase-like predicted oxidoreductase
MGKVGFGSYRISIKSAEHKTALVEALKAGCTLIDTSANYTNGESERLIGAVLSEFPEFNPIIVTKAGYIQGPNLKLLEELNSHGLAKEDIVDMDENLKHSIHPEFLKSQLDLSLARMEREYVDYFLLHNPEYYFKGENPSQSGYYERIKKAFIYCEEEVKAGRIKSYGISSNNFILPMNHPEVTDLKKVLDVAIEIGATNFKMVQFPFNLLEIEALEKLGEYGEESLLELCQHHNLVSVVNRPLNAFSQGQLVRLATYEQFTDKLDEQKAQELFDKCMLLVKEKWDQQVNSDQDGITNESDFYEIDIIKQFTEIWNKLPTPDAVDQVYHGHFFPFLARVWGSSGLNASEAEPFFDLFETSQLFSRKHLSMKAQSFREQAQKVGLLPLNEEIPFAVMAVETYLDYGFDYVLVGMKKPEYVDQMKHLF